MNVGQITAAGAGQTPDALARSAEYCCAPEAHHLLRDDADWRAVMAGAQQAGRAGGDRAEQPARGVVGRAGWGRWAPSGQPPAALPGQASIPLQHAHPSH